MVFFMCTFALLYVANRSSTKIPIAQDTAAKYESVVQESGYKTAFTRVAYGCNCVKADSCVNTHATWIISKIRRGICPINTDEMRFNELIALRSPEHYIGSL